MKRICLLLTFLIIVFLLAYLPNSQVINALRGDSNHSYWWQNPKNHILVNDEEKKTQEIKTPTGLITEEDKNLVVIDPGHGGNDPGTSKGNLLEKDISLDVALKLETLLKESHISTYMTRTDDTYFSIKERIYTANEKKAALFVSIHCNSFTDPAYHGTMTLYYPSDTLSFGYLTEVNYAHNIQNELVKFLGTKDRGIDARPNLAVLRHADMPSVIAELAFLSNKGDAELLATESFRQKAAEALAEAIKNSLNQISK